SARRPHRGDLADGIRRDSRGDGRGGARGARASAREAAEFLSGIGRGADWFGHARPRGAGAHGRNRRVYELIGPLGQLAALPFAGGRGEQSAAIASSGSRETIDGGE